MSEEPMQQLTEAIEDESTMPPSMDFPGCAPYDEELGARELARLVERGRTVTDIHTHVFPEKIATRAADSIGDFYDGFQLGMRTGSVAEVSRICQGSPITRHVVYSVATKPKNVESINAFIAEACVQHPDFVGFAAMHPDYPDVEGELRHCVELGLKGVKLHPDMQDVNLDDPGMMRIYEAAEGLGLPVVIHTGDFRTDTSHPRRLIPVLRAFPKLRVDAAHFGGWSVYDEAADLLEHENVYVDASSALAFLSPEHAVRLVRRYGTKRVLFGSDFPMWDPLGELRHFLTLGFTDEEYDDMLWNNAQRFLYGE